MKIFVLVKTNAKNNTVFRISNVDYKVSVAESPIDGKANKAIIKLLADYFNVSKSQVELIHGDSSKHKLFEIL